MNRSLKGICFTVAGGCCWGMSGVMGKYLFDAKDLTATWLVTVRLLGAGICLLLLMYQRKGNSIFRVWKRKDSAVNQLIFGMIGMAMCQMTYFLAIQESNPGTATVLQYSAPILIMVFFVLVEKRFPKKEEVLVLATVIVGIFLLATHGSIKNLVITNAALFWGLLSAFAFAVYNVQPKKLLDEFGTLETTGWGMFVGGVVFLGTIVAFSCYLHVRTSSGKYAWMRGTAGCNDSFRNRAWTGLWNDRCCWNLMYCWSSDGIDGFGCVIRHYGFAFEGKKVLIGG